MKIVQIVTQMEGGGAQRVAYLLHKAFQERAHISQLWFLYMKRKTHENAFDIRLLWPQKPAAFDYFRIIKRLHEWLEDYRPDAMICHTHYANVLGASVGLIGGIKQRVAVQHNPVQTYPGLSRQADWLCGNAGVYTKQVAVSEAVVRSMAAYPSRYQKNVSRIYNGIDLTREKDVAYEASLGSVAAGRKKILHVGRFSKQKNHDAMLAALVRIPDAHLLLAGDGERRGEIERAIQAMNLQDRVTLFGEITPHQVRALMSACDLFLFPSLYEAMPMALLEAMASGMPIVASDIPANRELLEDCGLLSQLDPEELAAAARRLLSDAPRGATLGKKAAERAARFTVSSMADAYEEMLLSA